MRGAADAVNQCGEDGYGCARGGALRLLLSIGRNETERRESVKCAGKHGQAGALAQGQAHRFPAKAGKRCAAKQKLRRAGIIWLGIRSRYSGRYDAPGR